MRHMKSHLDEQEAAEKRSPRSAREGNREADRLADAGAKQHAISETEMGCYEWARATAHLVRTRIAECTKDVINRRPGESRELKRARHAPTKARRARRTLKRHYLSSDGELRTTCRGRGEEEDGDAAAASKRSPGTRHSADSRSGSWRSAQGRRQQKGGASASMAWSRTRPTRCAG